jgi:hypothetical protein
VLVAELLKLFGINLLGQNPQRLVSLLQVTVTSQGVNHPLPAIRHMHLQACLQPTPRDRVIDPAVQDVLGAGVAYVPAVPRDEILVVALSRNEDAVFNREDRSPARAAKPADGIQGGGPRQPRFASS